MGDFFSKQCFRVTRYDCPNLSGQLSVYKRKINRGCQSVLNLHGVPMHIKLYIYTLYIPNHIAAACIYFVHT